MSFATNAVMTGVMKSDLVWTVLLPVVSLFGECVQSTVELSHIINGSHIVSVLRLGLLRYELPGHVDGGGRLVVGAGRHLEDDLHVVG